MSINFSPKVPDAAANITSKFKEANDLNIGGTLIPSSFKEKIKQKFADSAIKPDITYKDLSALTGKKYRWNRDDSKISFNEMTNIINEIEACQVDGEKIMAALKNPDEIKKSKSKGKLRELDLAIETAKRNITLLEKIV